MPYYADFVACPASDAWHGAGEGLPARARTIQRLQGLRAALDRVGPPRRSLNDTLVLGTWRPTIDA